MIGALAARYATVLTAALAGISAEPARPQVATDVEDLISTGAYDRAEAAARARVDELRAAGLNNSVTEATDALVQALLLNGRGAVAETLALAQQTLETKQASLGANDARLVPSLLNLGDALIAAGEHRQAIAVTERTVALAERTHVRVADALDVLGAALTEAGRYDEALAVLERSLSIRQATPDERPGAIARTLDRITFAHQCKGNYAAAGVAVRNAEAIRFRVDPQHPAHVDTLDLLGQQLWFEGRLLDARDASERAVALGDRALRPDHPTRARSLRYLAGTVADLGDLIRARALREQALAIVQRNFGASHVETALSLNSLAIAELELAMYPIARARFERVREVMEARYGRWHDFVATALLNLALVDARLGDYPVARREQADATAIWERVYGPSHPFVAVGLTELAMVYREQGSPTEALGLLERALAIREKSLGRGHRDVARTLADLASVLMQVGQVTRAQELASRALVIWEQLDAPDAPEYATVLALYAELQANRGDNAGARGYYERALAIRSKAFGASNPVHADAQAGLALVLANLGEWQAAVTAAVNAETTGREHLRLMLRSLPERQALNYAAARPRGLSLVLSVTGSVPEVGAVALNQLIQSRALVLDEMAARQSGSRGTVQNADPARAALASARQRLANLVVRGPGPLSPAQYVALVEDARHESELAEQALAESSVQFSAERSRAQVGLTEVLAALPPNAALVSFVRYDRSVFNNEVPGPATNRPARSTTPVPSYLAFVLRTNRPPALVPLGAASSVDRAVSTWRREASRGVLRPSTGTSESNYRRAGVTLRQMVWDPIATHLEESNRIFVVPDGALNVVNLAALPTDRGGYLIDQAAVIHHLSAERDLVAQPTDTSASIGVLALGGPTFNNSDTQPANARTAGLRDAGMPCPEIDALTFTPLPGTLQEATEVAGLWTRAGQPGEPSRGRASLVVGGAANEAGFKEQAAGHRVLHLATHGFFLGGPCAAPPGETRAVGGLVTAKPAAVRRVVPTGSPLLLSGLALAGANVRARAKQDEEDGILTAEEIAALNLEGTEWAVLSACDTGLGEIRAGEGVFGLRRAFQVAGVRTVIMSLWSVDDQATRQWMRALYEARLERKLDTADSVRAAALSVLHDRRAKGQSTHPFYWGAFVAAGDWR